MTAPIEPPHDPLNHRPRILAVDNDHATLDLFRFLFSNGIDVLTVDNGRDALDMLSEAPFDLVLLDVFMAEIDGLQVLQALRKTRAMLDLPVIIISAHAEPQDIVRGLRFGANDYITKPFNNHVIKARVDTQLAIKRAADERSAAFLQLQQVQEFQQQFFRIVSHDMRGPLTNVRLGNFMLRDYVHDDPEAVTVLDNVDATLNTMSGMLTMFRNALEFQVGALDVQLEPLNVCELVLSVIKQQTPSIRLKRVKIDTALTDCWIRADQQLVTQALSNLIGNAVKFSLPDTTTRVWTEQRGSMLRFCVHDQGPGIPEAERDMLFEQFSRLSPQPTALESSTGLGLWIVKQFIEIQGGRVGADFPDAGGSIFWFELPLASISAAE